MFRKIVFSSMLAVAVCVLFSGSAMAAGTGATTATGSFTVTINSAGVGLKASANVYINIATDGDDPTTSAVISAVNSKGSRSFAMDSDGGPLYYATVAVGTKTVAAIASTTGTDDVAAATGWSAL